ncbi:hypothetical protein [Corynebacterium sp. A21]|uniref:hypothetical protein n=1 Tax=Corynebacterium sp. A21 TaxID=3457318 RepID=UPI003FD3D3CC
MNPGLRRVLVVTWGTLLLGLLLYPIFAPGQLALRDMLVLNHPALSLSALGFGDLPARNAPQDGLLALVGLVVPASWFARVLIILGGVLGLIGASWLARYLRAGFFGQVAAVTVVLWNPFVVERFLQGHWSLVIAAWTLPLIAVAGFSRRPVVQWLAMWLASLTPTGALLALAVGVATARQRLITLAVGLALCLPWVVPGVLAGSTSTAAGAAAFAPRAEEGVGTLGSLLGLGGIWNADAVPPSREAGFAMLGVGLFIALLFGIRRCPPVLLWLGLLGLGGAVFTWLLPGTTAWLVGNVPGAGLLRDSQKLVILALPAYAALAASFRGVPAVAVLLLALAQVPTAPHDLRHLSPLVVEVDEELVEFAAGRDVLMIGGTALTEVDGRVILNPYSKALSLVESGQLLVDGETIDPPTPRWVAAREAWAQDDLAALAELGVGVVVDGDQVVETGAPAQRGPEFILGMVLLVAWMAAPLGFLLFGSRMKRLRLGRVRGGRGFRRGGGQGGSWQGGAGKPRSRKTSD